MGDYLHLRGQRVRGTAAGLAAAAAGVVLLLGCRARERQQTPNPSPSSWTLSEVTPTAAPPSGRIACAPGTRCLSVLVVHTETPLPPRLSGELLVAFAQTNRVFAPRGVSFRFAPNEDLRGVDAPRLDADCTLALPADRSLESYRDPAAPPPCDYEPHVRARLDLSAATPDRILILHGTKQELRYDSAAGHWAWARRTSSRASYFLPYLVLAPGAVGQPWLLAHELGHYFGLRHPHGPELEDLSALTRWLCARERNAPAHLLLDGDRGFVDDTPPDPLAAIYRAGGGPDACSTGESWRASPLELELRCGDVDQRHLRFDPPPLRQNAMSYWDKRCLDEPVSLTEGQGRVIRRALAAGHRALLLGQPRPPPPPPAAVRFQGFDHLFVTAADGSVRHHWTAPRAAPRLEAWLDTANDFAADTAFSPTALTTGRRLHLYVVDRRGRAQHKLWDGTRWLPEVQAWTDLGGALASRVIAVETGAAEPELLGRGRDGALWHRGPLREGGSAWRRCGENGPGPPLAAFLDDTLHVVARGRDGSLRHATRREGLWSEWRPIPLPAGAEGPALSAQSSRLLLVTRSRKGELFGARWSAGRWEPWTRAPAVHCAAAPTLVVGTRPPPVLLCTDPAGQLQRIELEPARLEPLRDGTRSLGGTKLVGPPTALADELGMRVLSLDRAGDLWATTDLASADPATPIWTFSGRW